MVAGARRVGILLCLGLSGCFNVLGPETKTGRTLRTGRVTNESGAPIVGARVFWSYHGWITSDGRPLVPDTAITDGSGNYRLETEHYCDSRLSAHAEGYLPANTRLGYLDCSHKQSAVVDFVLLALPPAASARHL